MKLPANASKEWSGTFKDLEKKRDKLKGKLRQVMAEHIHEDGLGGPEAEKGRKQRQRLEHQVERLSEFLQGAAAQDREGSQGDPGQWDG